MINLVLLLDSINLDNILKISWYIFLGILGIIFLTVLIGALLMGTKYIYSKLEDTVCHRVIPILFILLFLDGTFMLLSVLLLLFKIFFEAII